MKLKNEKKKYTVDEVFSLIGESHLRGEVVSLNHRKTNIVVDGFKVHPESLRYKTFFQCGISCVTCGRVGTYFQLTGDPSTKQRHFNLYSEDGTLMTKDHIVPKSLGGGDFVSNMQTMCVYCNSRKGNNL